MRFIFFSLLFINLHSLFAEEPKPILKMAVTGLNGMEELTRNFGPFQDALSEVTGYNIKFYPLSSRTIVIEALKSKTVDMVLFGPAEYVIATSKTKLWPVAGLTRPDYFSSIVVLSNSKIDSIQDLKNKKIGVGDFGSTAYHLGPLQLIQDSGLDLDKDLDIMNIAKQVAWIALKRGDIDALGIKNEQFLIFRDKETELESQDFKVIARGPDLPNDILVAGGHIDPKIAERIKILIKQNPEKLIKAILAGEDNKKYADMKFVSHLKDSDYDYVREMFKTIGFFEFTERVQ